jgi:hypothetical protein
MEACPIIEKKPLEYVFEDLELKHKADTLWLEFGVWKGTTINYISKFTDDKVYGFDSFYGLPEACLVAIMQEISASMEFRPR